MKRTLPAEPSEANAGEPPDPSTCPHCGHADIRRNGSIRGKRRFRCRSCGRTFSARTGTVRHYSHKDDPTWALYIKLMFQGLSLPVIVKRMDISLPTAFAWRHKVPTAMSRMPGPRLSGVVEADETYFRLSFKGQRGDLPRPARRRGRKSKKRGISKEKVRLLTATDRQRGTCLRSACLGRMSVDDLRRLLGDPVDWKGSVLVTDAHQAYAALAAERGTSHTELKGGRGEGSLHIQTVNSLHSHLKGWIRRFNGVATKYLDHYLLFFQRRGADPYPVMTAQGCWASARSLRRRPMALT